MSSRWLLRLPRDTSANPYLLRHIHWAINMPNSAWGIRWLFADIYWTYDGSYVRAISRQKDEYSHCSASLVGIEEINNRSRTDAYSSWRPQTRKCPCDDEAAKSRGFRSPHCWTEPNQDRNQIRGSSSVYIGQRCEDEGSESACTDSHCRHACCEYRGDVEVLGERDEYGIEDADA